MDELADESFCRPNAVVDELAYVNNLSVLLMPVHWLLMVGCSFLMSNASIIDSLLWLDWL